MNNAKACIVCLSTTAKLYDLDAQGLRQDYNLVSGLKLSQENERNLPKYICSVCGTYVKKFSSFQVKCQKAQYAFKVLSKSEDKNPEIILKNINHEALGLNSSLTFLNPEKLHYEETQCCSTEPQDPIHFNTDHSYIPVALISTLFDGLEFNKPRINIKPLEAEKETDFDESVQNFHEPNGVSNSSEVEFNDVVLEFDSEPDCEKDEPDCEKDESNSNTDEEGSLVKKYATFVPLNENEAKAAHHVMQLASKSKFQCSICSRKFKTNALLEKHKPMHDLHSHGVNQCHICYNHYKSEVLFRVHFSNHHKYKYLCTVCNEVTFTRPLAKTHYHLMHDLKPSVTAGSKRKHQKTQITSRSRRRRDKEKPSDGPIIKVVDQKTQYQMVLDRRLTKNYLQSELKCNLCYKGFREEKTYNKHMQKHDPDISGPLQCDICKWHFNNTRKLYKHMCTTHIFIHECQYCQYQCNASTQARSHYLYHKDVKYKCNHCDKEFSKVSTQLTHMRLKHPTTEVCTLCGHSFLSANGLAQHKNYKHSKEEVEWATTLSRGALGCEYQNMTDSEMSEIGYCDVCQLQFASNEAYTTHLHSSSNHVDFNLSAAKLTGPVPRSGRAHRPDRTADGKVRRRRRHAAEIHNNGVAIATKCDVCGEELKNDVFARKHYREQHPGVPLPKRFMCDVCGYATEMYSNLQAHMRSHTQEKPFACPHCDRRFTMPSNRDRHILIHTGEKKYECSHCHRRFTQNSARKLHIQTVHLKIPYAPWIKKNRKRNRETREPMTQGPSITMDNLVPVPPHKVIVESIGTQVGRIPNFVLAYTDE